MTPPLAEAAAVRGQRFFACLIGVLAVLLGKLTRANRCSTVPTPVPLTSESWRRGTEW